MPESKKTEKMKEIRDEVWDLTESPLYKYRKENNYYPVLGEGSHDAEIMFIGEAPGKNEAEQGRPFCGRAGKILDELIESIGLSRDEVYVTNIVKDRPPGNRDPLPEEIALYAPFMDRQIEAIRPEVVATLGRYSMNYIMERYGLSDAVEPISRAHGKTYELEMPYGKIALVPLYHPAAAIYTQSLKETLIKDFEILKKYNRDA